jgi:hypothetical protein
MAKTTTVAFQVLTLVGIPRVSEVHSVLDVIIRVKFMAAWMMKNKLKCLAPGSDLYIFNPTAFILCTWGEVMSL